MLNTAHNLPRGSRPSGPPATAVSLRSVSKSYRRGAAVTQVLNRVNFDVARGECVFLLGPSGSGKTTLLSIIGCLLSPDDGKLRVLDCDPTSLSSAELSRLRRDRLGFVFQKFHLVRGLNAAENVAVPLTLAGWTPARAQRRAQELLDQVGLSQHLRSDPRKMSVGQCQRIALARALAADPDLVLADEPTAALDADSGQQAMELLRRVTVDHGKTVVVVTHDHRILPYADRVVRVESGVLQEQTREGRRAAPAASAEPPRPIATPSIAPAFLEPVGA